MQTHTNSHTQYQVTYTHKDTETHS